MAAVRHLEFKKNNIWSRDCHVVPNLLLCTKFLQNWFTRQPLHALSYLGLMFNARLLGNGHYNGNRIMADMSGT